MSRLLMYVAEGPNPSRSTLTYNVDEEPVVHGGVISVEDDVFDALTSDPATAPLLKEVDTDYSDKSRNELEEAARNAGVSDPDDYDQYPTEGTLAVAIERSGEQATETPAQESVQAAPEPEAVPEPQPEEGQ
jgi:hypothetical protein